MMGDKAEKFNNVYVKNLSDDLDDDGLREMFERFGKVLSPKVMRTSDGRSRGFGFVSFEEPEAAEKAMVEMNGKRLGDKVLIACPAKKKAERQAELNEHAQKKAERQAELERKLKCKFTNRYEGVNLYVKNLDDVIDDEHLHKEFSQFGTITSAKVMRTSDGRSKGFGFVNFEEPESAEKAVEQMNGKKLGEKVLYVCPAKNKAEREAELKELAQKKAERQAELEKKLKGKKLEFTNHYEGVNLYVKNLDDVIDEKRLCKEFSQFGTITSAKVMSEKGRAKGCGFVCFSSPEEAQKAISEMNGHVLEGKSLHVAFAQSKEERKAHLASQQQLSSKKMQKKQAANRTMALRSDETPYRQLLQELAEGLTSDEVSQLVFLLRFHIKGKKARSEIKSDATKLLTELEKLDCIGVDNLTLLVELFELIGCTDLINRIVEKLGHSCQVSKHEVNEFMRILWKFGQKFDLDDLNNAKCILDWTQKKENIEKVWQLFEKAFERGLLEQDNFSMLERFAESIKQREKLNSVMNQGPGISNSEVIGAGDSIKRHGDADPGNVSASGTIQVEYLYRRVGMKDQQEEMPAQMHQYPAQNTLNKSKEDKTIQKKANDVEETDSSSGDLNLTLGQAVQSKTEFKGPIDLTPVTSITTVDQRSEQASIRVEQKEASQVVQQELDHTEAKTVRKMTDTVHSHNDLNMTSGPGVQAELKEFSSKVQHDITVDPRPEQVSRKSEEKEEIQDIKDAKNRRKTAVKGHSPDDINLTLEQPVQTKTGEFARHNSNVDPESEQESIGKTSPSCDSSNVKDERECQSSADTDLFSSSTEGTTANPGAIRLQELVDESIPGSRSQEQSQRLQESGVSQTTETKYDTFSTTRRLEVCLTKNPRRGRIMVLTVEEMKSYIREKIGSGAFGDVYKAKMSGSNFEFAIKEIKVKNEFKWKTYEKEIHSGRILHPFINPVIARAEKPPSKSEEGVSYLMYPYMQNKDLRQNIDLENNGIRLSEEPNSIIWTRCIYQIAQAVDYLHKPVTSIRGAVFHRDLSSRNIFLDEDFNVKIGDFGVALEAKENAKHATITRTMGTEGYHPPNMSQYRYDPSYDVFSVGVVMLEILTGEEAMLEEDGSYLHEKYRNKGYEYLIDQLDQRPEETENKAAKWLDETCRNKLAEIALKIVSLDETQRKMDNLLQELDDMRLDSCHRYRKPASQDGCVSCYVNPPATLSLKGVHCANIESPCQYFCRHCLMTNDINPLVCPQHGKTRPPFGDHVYGVFVAGNNVEGMQQFSYGDEPSKIAQMFIRDVEKVVDVLTAKHPFVLGASAECLKVVKPNNPGTKEEMGKHIENAFEEVSLMIKESKKNTTERKVQKNEQEEGGRLPNSLFIFYFSGHCCKKNGLYLGKEDETLKASTKWIKEMLHEKLHVDQVLVILDCCHADSQNFTDSQGLNSITCSTNGEKVRIHQLSSCDTDQKSVIPCTDQGHGSLFTNILCKGLQGLDSKKVGENAIFCCDKCEIQRGNKDNMAMKLPCVKYHLRCDSDHAVTLTALKDFILGHFDLPVSDTDGTKCMSPTSSSQRERQLFLTYYNQDKLHISIHLKGIPECFRFSSLPETIDKLKQDIIIHTVEQNVDCDVLLFHQNYTQNSSQLIAIYPKYGRDKDEELTTLGCIYKAWRSNCELEVRVRETLKGLLNGPIKISTIKKSMVTLHEASFNEDYLKISQNDLEMAIKCKNEAENQIKEIRISASPTQLKEFRKFLQEILNVTQNIPSSILEKKHDKVLKFYFYDDFSVLNIE